MHLRAHLVRALHKVNVKGHPTDPERLFVGEWIRGAVLMAWALGAGGFIVGGGGFQGQAYEALNSTFPCARLLGGILVASGLLGVIGTWVDWRILTKLSCLLCAGWHTMFFSYTFPANLGLFGNSNLISLFALVMALIYLVQLYVIWGQPTEKAVTR